MSKEEEFVEIYCLSCGLTTADDVSDECEVCSAPLLPREEEGHE
jgi:hypothetical protein